MKKIAMKGVDDLSTVRPDLAEDWHPTNELKPYEVTAGSNKKVRWICKEGHVWDTTVQSRAKRNTGCPYCSGLYPIKGETDLETKRPDVAKDWHPTKNGELKPSDLTEKCGRKVWWVCELGHEWKTAVYLRTSSGHGCPYCAGQLAIKGENDLETVVPELAADWHPTKNGDLKPSDVLPRSGKKVWWKCDKGHEWRTPVYSRYKKTKLSGCPYCNGNHDISEERSVMELPDLMKEWDFSKNRIEPRRIGKASNELVWWKCSEGHEWRTKPSMRTRRGAETKCPYCKVRKISPGETDAATLSEEVRNRWDYEKNGPLLNDLPKDSKRKFSWICPKGHSYEASVSDVVYGKKLCQECRNPPDIGGKNEKEKFSGNERRVGGRVASDEERKAKADGRYGTVG